MLEIDVDKKVSNFFLRIFEPSNNLTHAKEFGKELKIKWRHKMIQSFIRFQVNTWEITQRQKKIHKSLPIRFSENFRCQR